ncbi:MAG: hypothetical protein HW416_707 [Chloroflexi bacterium]|nr:hypothetical protein [Chloroflexota bacterium]
MANNRILVSLLSLAIALSVSVAPVQAQSLPGEDEETEPGLVDSQEFCTADKPLTVANSVELALWQLTNAARVQNGLPELTYDVDLIAVARMRASDQVAQPLSHLDSSGEQAYMTLIDETGLLFSVAGENLARVFGPSTGVAQRAEDMLMDSPIHRALILEQRFHSMAVGSITDPDGGVIFAQIFLGQVV